MQTKTWKNPKELLEYLNKMYAKVHTDYERHFWTSYMGDHSVDEKKDKALEAREHFRTDVLLFEAVKSFLPKATGELKDRLNGWKEFFLSYQTPEELKSLRQKMAELETKIDAKRATRKEGYIDPKTKQFVQMSKNGMRSLIGTNDDEAVRKACFEAVEELAQVCLSEYVEMVQMRNEYAKKQGFSDFYAYKLAIEERMTKKELFDIFDEIYEKTKYAFKDIRALEKTKPGLRKPWNFRYLLSSSFTKEADQYYPFEDAVWWWVETFARLGVTFRGGKIVLDLLERDGKYDNGFCHWPVAVSYEGKKRIPGTADFTCNVSLGLPGQSFNGIHTLFHEGGHAAHLLNADNKDCCLNVEYPPASTAWDETQSMFMDSISSSVVWRTRYAKNKEGKYYPFDLFERQVTALHPLRPLGLMSILMVSNFEKEIYATKNLTEEKVKQIARKHHKKYTDYSVDSLWLLDVPHIYNWESACSYHGYGLAELAVHQWRAYFSKKYGYIVDNPNIAKEMQKVWKYGSKYPFMQMVKMATGKKLSAKAFVDDVTMPLAKVIKKSKENIEKLLKVKQKPIDGSSLDVTIVFSHGKQIIASSEKMPVKQAVEKYAKWLKTQYKKHD